MKKSSSEKSRRIPQNIRDGCLKSFQRLRRLEEANDSGFVRCISCGRILKWKDAEGGHYISRANRATEMERDNVWPQCHECNNLLHGNLEEYRARLVEKIGEERVRRIEDMADAKTGSEEAMERLSEKDRIEVVRIRDHRYYLKKKRGFDKDFEKIYRSS